MQVGKSWMGLQASQLYFCRPIKKCRYAKTLDTSEDLLTCDIVANLERSVSNRRETYLSRHSLKKAASLCPNSHQHLVCSISGNY